jgi:hypothetical protein
MGLLVVASRQNPTIPRIEPKISELWKPSPWQQVMTVKIVGGSRHGSIFHQPDVRTNLRHAIREPLQQFRPNLGTNLHYCARFASQKVMASRTRKPIDRFSVLAMPRRAANGFSSIFTD